MKTVIGGVCLLCTLFPNWLLAQARDAQYWLPATYNYQFYDRHPAAARSFYAAHFAHFGVYERAMQTGDLATAMHDLQTEVLRLIDDPPRFEPAMEAIAPRWSKLSYATGRSMDWTHHLHEQLYDILSDPKIADKKAAGDRAIAYYLSNTNSAFATRGYGHAFMLAGGTWAESFRHQFPEMNSVLWAYHWHHAAIYEALLAPTEAEREAELTRTLTTFTDSVLPNPPTVMPLVGQVAPRFAEIFPAAAHIFDNLHMMHDVANDIMVDSTLSRDQQQSEIQRLLGQMLYVNQESVMPPTVPMGAMRMGPWPMTRPTQRADGSWLPQGHPDAEPTMSMPRGRNE